mgnify:FL=1
MKRYRYVLPAILLLCNSAPPVLLAQDAAHHVVILSHDTNDVRLPMTLEAITFWNNTSAELGLNLKVIEQVIIRSSVERQLENYARSISQRAGRLRPGPSEPDAPVEITDFESDVVLLLSRQDLMSFAWPLPRRPGHFIAIEEDRYTMAQNPNIARNIIAHEIGHTLGLPHNNDPTSLMCGPCRTNELSIDHPQYMHLTETDIQILRKRYSFR